MLWLVPITIAKLLFDSLLIQPFCKRDNFRTRPFCYDFSHRLLVFLIEKAKKTRDDGALAGVAGFGATRPVGVPARFVA